MKTTNNKHFIPVNMALNLSTTCVFLKNALELIEPDSTAMTYSWYVITWISLISAFLAGIKVFVHFNYDNDKELKARRELEIGYGGLMICGMVPQISALLWPGLEYFLLSTGLVCNLASFVLLPLFIMWNWKNYEIKDQTACISPIKIIFYLIHLSFAIFALILHFKFMDREESRMLPWFICYYSFFYPCCTCEFVAIKKNGIRLMETTVDQTTVVEILPGGKKNDVEEGEEMTKLL